MSGSRIGGRDPCRALGDLPEKIRYLRIKRWLSQKSRKYGVGELRRLISPTGIGSAVDLLLRIVGGSERDRR